MDNKENKQESLAQKANKKTEPSNKVKFLKEELSNVDRRIDAIEQRKQQIETELEHVTLLKEALLDKISKTT